MKHVLFEEHFETFSFNLEVLIWEQVLLHTESGYHFLNNKHYAQTHFSSMDFNSQRLKKEVKTGTGSQQWYEIMNMWFDVQVLPHNIWLFKKTEEMKLNLFFFLASPPQKQNREMAQNFLFAMSEFNSSNYSNTTTKKLRYKSAFQSTSNVR